MVNFFSFDSLMEIFFLVGLIGEGIFLSVDSLIKDFIVFFDFFFGGEVCVFIVIEIDNLDFYIVYYIINNELILLVVLEIFYGMGYWNGWRRIVWNLDIDLRKGLCFFDGKNGKRSKLFFIEI